MTIFVLDRALPAVAPRARRPSWLARFIAAVHASRMRSAQAVIARYRGFMPITPDPAGEAPSARDADPPLRLVHDRSRSSKTKRPGL